MPDTPIPSSPLPPHAPAAAAPSPAPDPSDAPETAAAAQASVAPVAVPASEAVAAQVEQLQTGQALDEAAQAVAAAQKTAQEIASDIQTVGAVEPPPSLRDTAAQAAAADPPSAAPENPPGFSPPSNELRRLLAIEVPVIVQLGSRRMTVAEVMRFAVGAIIEFSKSAEEELELLANNKAIGKGQAVKVGENFGIKVSSIGSVKEMIRQLGAA